MKNDFDENDIPKFWEFCNPILKYLKDEGIAKAVKSITEDVSEIVRKERKLPESIYEVKVSTGYVKIYDRLTWCLYLYLLKMEYVKRKSRGFYEITEKGILEYPLQDVKKKFAKYKIGWGKNKDIKQDEGIYDGKDKSMEYEKENQWQQKLLKKLRELAPKNFEKLCKKILECNSFVDVHVTGKANDHGIDGIGILRQSLISIKVLFQCKRYNASNKITPSVVRDFRGSMSGRANYGLIITTSDFTDEAKKEATRDGVDPIELIDGFELCDLIKKSNELGVKSQMIEEVFINEDFWTNYNKD